MSIPPSQHTRIAAPAEPALAHARCRWLPRYSVRAATGGVVIGDLRFTAIGDAGQKQNNDTPSTKKTIDVYIEGKGKR